MSFVLRLCVVGVVGTLAGCAGGRSVRTGAPGQDVRFDPVHVVGDPELEKLNDEELFAGGTSSYAAGEYRNAARYFGRLVDSFPQSTHRRVALYQAGLAHERLEEWQLAYQRFIELADPQKGTGDALDAVFRAAETLYHMERHAEAAALLEVIAHRVDLPVNKRIEAQVQHGICLLEAGLSQPAEASLRKALAIWNELSNKDEVDTYFPAQAQFFLGEIYRLHCDSAALDPSKGTDALANALEEKAQLLLSAQGHYLRAIRLGHPYWATAAGAQIGGLYERLYEQMVSSPAPPELTGEQVELYRQELRKKIRVLLTKAINIYESTLEAAERIGAQNAFVDKTRASLKKMKDLLLADAQREEAEGGSKPAGSAAAADEAGPVPQDASGVDEEPHT
jgi:tetratricopeptide (TPR) repeat protein